MNKLLIALVLASPCCLAANYALVMKCERITIKEQGLTDAYSITAQKIACRKDPKHEICSYLGVKHHRGAGRVPNVEAVDELENQCA